MAERTGIAWTHSTFNPWMGCTRVSLECANCYAEHNLASAMKKVRWGDNEDRRTMALSNWLKPLAWERRARQNGEQWRVFCGSLCDVLDSRAPAGQLDRLIKTVSATPHLTWLLLTKREQNFHLLPSPLPKNIWLGVTAGNQEMLERRAAEVAKVHAAVRFVSYEPALGPLDLSRIPEGSIHWLICGCESGKKRRPMQLEWALGVRNQCEKLGIAFFMKQLDDQGTVTGDLSEFPKELQVREFPTAQQTTAREGTVLPPAPSAPAITKPDILTDLQTSLNSEKLDHLASGLTDDEVKHESLLRQQLIRTLGLMWNSRFEMGSVLHGYQLLYKKTRTWEAFCQAIHCNVRTARRLIEGFQAASVLGQTLRDAAADSGFDLASRKNRELLQRLISLAPKEVEVAPEEATRLVRSATTQNSGIAARTRPKRSQEQDLDAMCRSVIRFLDGLPQADRQVYFSDLVVRISRHYHGMGTKPIRPSVALHQDLLTFQE